LSEKISALSSEKSPFCRVEMICDVNEVLEATTKSDEREKKRSEKFKPSSEGREVVWKA
jgi:hypothetical protein